MSGISRATISSRLSSSCSRRMTRFDYACHEGNYAMNGMLAGARAEEAAASGGR